MERCGTGEAHGDAALFATGGAAGGGERVVDVGEDRPRILEQGAPGVGQLHPARFAPQQLHPQLGFQSADLLAERRLLHPQAFSGACDVAFLGHGDEVAEVPEFHLPYLFDMDFASAILWFDCQPAS